MKIKTVLTVLLAASLFTACKHDGKAPRKEFKQAISTSTPAKGDSAIYGLACMGCTDSVVVLLPNAGGDPIRYNILEAMRNHQVFGDIEIGDWVAVVPHPKYPKRATLVVDLDKLKATWTYQVMPHLRDVTHLSKRQQARILANMPDSIVETYMIPRAYGFTLKRMSEARSVGFVMQSTSVEDDSPVEYPSVPNYTEWHTYNGKLILVQGKNEFNQDEKEVVSRNDTLSFVYMKGDSLALCNKDGVITSYHRSKNAQEANAAAQAAATKQANKLKQELK